MSRQCFLLLAQLEWNMLMALSKVLLESELRIVRI